MKELDELITYLSEGVLSEIDDKFVISVDPIVVELAESIKEKLPDT